MAIIAGTVGWSTEGRSTIEAAILYLALPVDRAPLDPPYGYSAVFAELTGASILPVLATDMFCCFFWAVTG